MSMGKDKEIYNNANTNFSTTNNNKNTNIHTTTTTDNATTTTTTNKVLKGECIHCGHDPFLNYSQKKRNQDYLHQHYSHHHHNNDMKIKPMKKINKNQ